MPSSCFSVVALMTVANFVMVLVAADAASDIAVTFVTIADAFFRFLVI